MDIEPIAVINVAIKDTIIHLLLSIIYLLYNINYFFDAALEDLLKGVSLTLSDKLADLDLTSFLFKLLPTHVAYIFFAISNNTK